MERYEVKLRSSGTYGIFVEGKGFIDIEDVCAILNAHAGMKTREEVENEIAFLEGSLEDREFRRALKSVLNKE